MKTGHLTAFRFVRFLFLFGFTACSFVFPAFAEPAVEIIQSATVAQKGSVHIIFREIITSKQQSDWTAVYNATVEVQIQQADGSSEKQDRKSTRLNSSHLG